jgi:hypothetical protein
MTMREHDKLHESVKALKNCDVPDGPPEQTVERTVAALQGATEDWNTVRQSMRFAYASTWMKWAVAAMVLILLGFSVGRFTTPKALDGQQMAALESRLLTRLGPAITQEVGHALSQDLHTVQAAGYTRLNEALDQRLQESMREYAIQILAASNASANQLMDNLVQAIRVAQVQERQRLASVIKEIEFDRLQKDTQVRKSLANVALLTENHLQTTQELVSLIAHEQSNDRTE